MTEIVNADNKRVIPETAPLGAHELVRTLPYGPVNGVEAGFQESDIVQVGQEDQDASPEVVEESNRGDSGAERLKQGSSKNDDK